MKPDVGGLIRVLTVSAELLVLVVGGTKLLLWAVKKLHL